MTRNLWDFLQILQANDDNEWYWADQISMNQSDENERNHQVGLMSEIYSQARSVHAWIGHPVQAVGKSIFKTNLLAPFRLKSLGNEYEAIQELAELFTRPYWDRLWIVQELRLAREVQVWYGVCSVQGPSLSLTAFWMLTRLDEPIRMQGTVPKSCGESLRHIIGRCTDTRLRMIMALLFQKDRSGRSGLSNLWETIVPQFHQQRCSDPRDKIFGLQALVEPRFRVVVDYSKSLEMLVVELVCILLNHEITFRQAGEDLRNASSSPVREIASQLSGNTRLADHLDHVDELSYYAYGHRFESMSLSQVLDTEYASMNDDSAELPFGQELERLARQYGIICRHMFRQSHPYLGLT